MADCEQMIIVLNGPLGVGKSTLAEALAERIDGAIMLDGDHLLAVNPEPASPSEYLRGILALLVDHHRRHGYRQFVINHIWTPSELVELARALGIVEGGEEFRAFLLTLPLEDNLGRVERRQGARVIDEAELERETLVRERAALYEAQCAGLGEPFDVSAPPERLVEELVARLGLG